MREIETMIPKSKLQLKVGEYYRRRDGELRQIVNDDNHDRFPMDGDNGESYTRCGFALASDRPQPEDLVEHIPPTDPRHPDYKAAPVTDPNDPGDDWDDETRWAPTETSLHSLCTIIDVTSYPNKA